MRVLIISNIFPPGFIGGYELGALDVARGLQSAGHEVRVLTSDYMLDDGRVLADLSVARILECVDISRFAIQPLEQARRGSFVNPRNLRRLGSELIGFEPACVMCFNTSGLGTLGLAQFLVGLGISPLFYLMDDVFEGINRIPKERERARCIFGGMQFLDAVEFILMSNNLRSQVETSLGHTLRNVTIVPGWSDPDADYDSLPPPNTTAGDCTRFVFTSRVAGHKGIDIVVDAVCCLVADGRCDFVVDVFGAGDTPQLLQRIAANGLTEQIRYRGLLPKSEMTRRLAEYDALLFPTWEREPFGFVVPEAASAGCIPVVTSGIGAAEWLFDGTECLKIRRDASGLAEAMLGLLLMPPADKFAMRLRCRQAGRRLFRFSDALQRINGVLHRSAADSHLPSSAGVRGVEAAMTLLDDMWRPSEIV